MGSRKRPATGHNAAEPLQVAVAVDRAPCPRIGPQPAERDLREQSSQRRTHRACSHAGHRWRPGHAATRSRRRAPRAGRWRRGHPGHRRTVAASSRQRQPATTSSCPAPNPNLASAPAAAKPVIAAPSGGAANISLDTTGCRPSRRLSAGRKQINESQLHRIVDRPGNN